MINTSIQKIEINRTLRFGTKINSSLKTISEKTVETVAVMMPVFFLLTALVLENLFPAYSRIRDTISTLVWGPGGWGLTVVFFLFGLVLMSLALRLGTIIGDNRYLKIGLSILFILGVGFIFIAIFPTRAPGAAQSVKAFIHLQTARGVSAGFPLVCLFIAIGLRNRPDWQLVRLTSLAGGVVGIILVVAGAITSFNGDAYMGLVERIIVGNGLLWMEIVGLSLTFPKFRMFFSERLAVVQLNNRVSMTPVPQRVLVRHSNEK